MQTVAYEIVNGSYVPTGDNKQASDVKVPTAFFDKIKLVPRQLF